MGTLCTTRAWRLPWRLTCMLSGLCVTMPVLAAPTLSAGMIADLRGLEEQLPESPAVVEARASSQAQRLADGNAADRWARALYLQLAAGAEAAQGKLIEAADHLAQARSIEGIESSLAGRWLRQEADLRLQAGQSPQGRRLLDQWLANHDGDAAAFWQMAQLEAELENWAGAADWVAKANQTDTTPTADQLAFTAAVMQRSGRLDEALQALQRRLDDSADDPQAWRRAAGLSQQLGDPVRAAAIWEAGWHKGLLEGREDLIQRIRLQLAAGSPARAAEMLSAALANGSLPEDEENLRLLAESWHLARNRQQALTAWQQLAEMTQQANDWMHLGQLATAWGEESIARDALALAEERGAEQAEEWRALLEAEGVPKRALNALDDISSASEPL